VLLLSISQLIEWEIHFTVQAQQSHETLVLTGSTLSFSFNVGATESVALACNHFGWSEVIMGLPALKEMLMVFRRLSQHCRDELEAGRRDPLRDRMAKLGVKPSWMRTALRKLPPQMLCALVKGLDLDSFKQFTFPLHCPKEQTAERVREMVDLLHSCVELYVCYDEDSATAGGVYSACSCMLDPQKMSAAVSSYATAVRTKARLMSEAQSLDAGRAKQLRELLANSAGPFRGWVHDLVDDGILHADEACDGVARMDEV
jgi:hypothetical protein